MKAPVLDSENGYLYATTFQSPPTIIRIRTVDFLRTDSFVVPGLGPISAGVYNAKTKSTFFCTYSSPSTVFEVSKMGRVHRSLTLNSEQDYAYTMLLDDSPACCSSAPSPPPPG